MLYLFSGTSQKEGQDWQGDFASYPRKNGRLNGDVYCAALGGPWQVATIVASQALLSIFLRNIS